MSHLLFRETLQLFPANVDRNIRRSYHDIKRVRLSIGFSAVPSDKVFH